MFTQDELADIRDKAQYAQDGMIAERWRRAYVALSDAADRLWLMKDRTVDNTVRNIVDKVFAQEVTDENND